MATDVKVVKGVFIVQEPRSRFKLKAERIDQEYDAYHWMQKIHEPSKKYPYISVFEEELLRLHNDVRSNPRRYARMLEDWVKWYDPQTSTVNLPSNDLILREGPEVLKEAINYLRSPLGKFQPFVPCKALCYAEQLHCHAAGKLGLDSHVSPSLVSLDRFQQILDTGKRSEMQFQNAQNRQEVRSKLSFDVKTAEMTGPGARASAFLTQQDSVAENCCFGPMTPLEVLLCLVVDDGVKNRGHRCTIFNETHRLVGVAHGLHAYSGVMSAMNFCAQLRGAEHADIDSLLVLQRRRLTLHDFKDTSDVFDVVRPRMCVGCGGVCLGNSRRMRKYRGLDANGQELVGAFCHPGCDMCPHCGKLIEESGNNMAVCYTRHGKTRRVHQRCVAEAFQMYCKVCNAETTENFLEYNEVNRPALDNIKDLIKERMGRTWWLRKSLEEGDLVCNACAQSMFDEYRLRVKGGELCGGNSGRKEKGRPAQKGYPTREAEEKCHVCGKGILTGMRRVQMDCHWAHETCYKKSLEVPCAHCKKTIKAGDARVSAGKKEIHKRCLEPFYAAQPALEPGLLGKEELHTCVYCKKDIGSGEGPTMFEGKWYHKACCEAKFVAGGCKGPSMNKTCESCHKEISISEAIQVTGRWLHRRCWEASQLASCAFCGGSITDVSQKALLNGQTLHPTCVKPFLESQTVSGAAQGAPAETCGYCGQLIKGAVPVLHAEGKIWHKSCRRKSQEKKCNYCGKMIVDVHHRSEVAGEGVFHHGCVAPYLAQQKRRPALPSSKVQT